MVFAETELPGAFLIEAEPVQDERGWFTRILCEQEFTEHGLEPHISQCSMSFNARANTLRGMHYQRSPYAESKLVRCYRGALYDVIVDLRPGSPTYCRWQAFELSERNGAMLYIPEGMAHGYQALADETSVFYAMSRAYLPDYSTGVRWDDPAFGIVWPDADARLISDRDRSFPDFQR